MLNIQSISLMAGLKPLLKNASLTLHPGQKVGLIGQNGAGKSTLLKAILKEASLEAGNIAMPDTWQIGYVEQEQTHLSFSAIDYVTTGDTLYANARARIDQAELANDHDALVTSYDELDRISGYEVPQKAQQLLFGLGFSETEFDKPVEAFSGGWQVRLKLARALMQRADLLLLDEPTNHLDIEAVSWLIQWLKGFSGAVIVISHDRHFLDEVVQGIAHLDQEKIQYYSGNFAAFEHQRNEQLMQQQALHDKQKQQMQHLKSFIERFKAKASKAKQAQSRVKALERIESVAAVQASNPFQFHFAEPDHLPDPMLFSEALSFGYDDHLILNEVDLTLRAGDRIGLVGVNGSGKSTLLKLLIKENTPKSGKLVHSKGLKIGYFAQHQLESLNLDQTPLAHMLALSKDNMERVTDQEARDFLGQFGFSHDKTLNPIKYFSGGEKARLSLALMVYQKPNLIILDEPTNHLDMETRDALEMALQEFSGALILVTHDQHLLTCIVDQFWWVHDQRVERYHGDLEAYLQQRLRELKEKQAEIKAEKTARPGQISQSHHGSGANKKAQRQENAHYRKQLKEATRNQTKQLSKVEKKLSEAQKQLVELHAEMEDASLYEAGRAEELKSILKQEAQLKTSVEELEEEWLLLEAEIEDITNSF
ncbi:ATP-binding cassette domain-containing protein [Hydrogenovibrio sp. 3SP14C1]|uniref:ABC-F family ATP-binding cassette domain-containing protein n=1 Tax=Hydrogenovibrio sp. 3SP14C1 TaxID=3038774 RepID=UPI00241732B1|nr:ATP-binding cassette domain-containing protein [Hydrogenovibrio sp. 3SP14C1]MDG4813604.1 ATP-binding cassette domain-containing protein [Hydrogenovibrio sp. 3SP14C1]